jgi:queuine tRNA-ribosyltransferase
MPTSSSRILQSSNLLSYPHHSFTIHHKDSKSKARLGTLTTPHGSIETPNYIFCGTKASVKTMSPADLKTAKTDIILANTYHLMLQPGADLIEAQGGIHKFMGWDGPMLTDSGGFQVFSLGEGTMADEIKGRNLGKHDNKSMLKITEEGATFRSHIDGRKINLTPERAMEIQRQIGADLLMQFDECTPYHVTRDYTAKSMEMSMRWGDRSLSQFAKTHNGAQAVYGIIQGGVYEDLRTISAQWTKDRPFFGTAVGGCLGGSDEEMEAIVRSSLDNAAPDRPVHFLGIGKIKDIFKFVRYGVDTFDCVIPTRLARHGTAFMKGVKGETINITNARYREDKTPLDENNGVPASTDFSKSYIHHLVKSGESLGIQLLTQHNIATINRLMREVRAAIKNGTLDKLEKEWLPD